MNTTPRLALLLLVLAPWARAGGATELVIYEVADLLDAQLEVVAVQDDVSEDARRAEEGAVLVELVREFVQPRFDGGRHTLRLLGEGSLVAQLDDAQHQWLQAFLAAQRLEAEGDQLVLMEALVVSGAREALARHGLDAAELVLAPGAVERLESALRGDVDVQVITAPMLAVYPRQRANISVVNALSYVSRWDLHVVEPDARAVLDPVIETVQEGVVWEARAVALGDGRWGVQVGLELAEVERPLAVRPVRPSPDLPAQEISIPVVTTVSVASTLALAPGGAAVLMAPRGDDEEVAVIVAFDAVVETEVTETAFEDAEPEAPVVAPRPETRRKLGGR